MKKSLIALAVAGAFAAPSAMADVTLSGAINMGLLYGDSNGPGDVSKNSLFAGYSNFNLTSVDDIGNGNKVVFNFQFLLEGNLPVTSATGLGNRNSYLGIMGDWGAVKWGTNENVYERLMYSSDFLDGAYGPGGNLLILGNPGVGTAFDAGQGACAPGAAAGCVGFYRRTDHTVWYESPNWNGFSFEVDYTLSAYKTATADPKVLSLGGKYQPEGMPFWVDAGYETHDDFGGIDQIAAQKGIGAGGSTSTEATGLQIGGGYMFGDFTVGLRWERLEYEGNSAAAGDLTAWERDAFFINGKMNLPTGYAAVQVGIADEADCTVNGAACSAVDTGATMIAVGYAHNLSRQSQILVIYNQTDNDANAAYLAIGGTNGGTSGVDHKGIYLGLKHTF